MIENSQYSNILFRRTLIKLNNIEKKYTVDLFNKVSYSFKEGYIYLLAGDMGTGKSTMLKMIVGLTKPTSGQISHTYERKEFVYNEAWHYIYQNVSVYANLMFYKDLFKCTDEHYLGICELFKLEEIKNSKVSKLSDGNRKKVSLACSFLNSNAKVYILDEPFVNLDQTTINILINYLTKIKEGKIIIIASHQSEDVKKYIDVQLRIINKQLLEN